MLPVLKPELVSVVLTTWSDADFTSLPCLNLVGPFRLGKKRNTSLQELSESPMKKPKVEYSKIQTQKGAQITKDDKCYSLGEQRKSGAISKQKSKGGKGESKIKSPADSSGIQELHSKTAGEDKGKQQKDSPLKHKHVATPEDIQKSPRKVVGKKLKLDLIGNEGQGNTKDGLNAREESLSDESSDDEGVAWEDVDGMYILTVSSPGSS